MQSTASIAKIFSQVHFARNFFFCPAKDLLDLERPVVCGNNNYIIHKHNLHRYLPITGHLNFPLPSPHSIPL